MWHLSHFCGHLAEGQRIFPALRTLTAHDVKSAWSGAIYYTLDDYPFVERRHGGRVITFAAPSDHGNSLAAVAHKELGAVPQKCLATGGGNDYVPHRPISHVPVAVCRSVGIRTRGRTAA